MKNFESFLAPQLNDYLLHRKTLGYSTRVSRAHLLVFDQYLRKTNADGSITGFLMNGLDFDSTVHSCNSQKRDRMCHYK